MIPPGISGVLPLPEIARLLPDRGMVILGCESTVEDESDPIDPSVLQ
jgi:hypothetical protein